MAPVELHHDPLVRAFKAVGGSRLRHAVLETNHDLARRRIALASEIVNWLDEAGRFSDAA